MRESHIERAVCGYARTKGWRNMKLNGSGNRGQPDRLFYTVEARLKFIEFKAPGESPRPLQRYQLESLKAHGFEVYVVDNVEAGKALFDEQG